MEDQPRHDDRRLEDLAAAVMSRGTILTSEQVAGFRVALARMEGKLDVAIALKADFEKFEEAASIRFEEVNDRAHVMELKVNSLEGSLSSFKAVALWVAGVGGMILAGTVGTLFTFFLNKGP